MVGIWCVLQWQKLGSPKELRLVELGPGRGTLMADLLRGVGALPCPTDALHVHLVEVNFLGIKGNHGLLITKIFCLLSYCGVVHQIIICRF